MDPTDTPNLMDQASVEYPILKDSGVKYKEDFGRGMGFLESWPPGETGSDELKRPAEFGIKDFGVEVYDRTTRPIDIMGDVASHHLKDTDPTVKGAYDEFQNSMEPWQHEILGRQYEHAKQAYGEDRSYADWRKDSGQPAYFRGYTFKQWDQPENYYTKDQMKKLDGVTDYLKGKK